MKLKFKLQSYQSDAVNAVINCFSGQSRGTNQDILSRDGTIEEISYSNKRIETNVNLLENLKKVQKSNNIIQNTSLDGNDYTIEMETGTGKTYTYIKTMFELYEHYGWSKYIVMVPSIAIREGVKKSFEITEDHFQEYYGKKIRYFVYDTSNKTSLAANIFSFATNDSIQVIIMNYQAFNSRSQEARRIYMELDEMQSRLPIDVIKSVNPIIILDEPQKFGLQTEELIKGFNPLIKLRYSATHKKLYNKIYRLDAIDAYNQKLVKKINVKGIEILGSTGTNSYLFLDQIRISRQDPVALIEFEIRQNSGIKKVLRKVEVNDNLYELSGFLEEYKGFQISEINATNNCVHFSNGIEIKTGQAFGEIEESHIRRIQIRETIRSHFEKEQNLFENGIKVLSLFFIDEVAKYRVYDCDYSNGEYGRIFEEEYISLVNEYRNIINNKYLEYLDRFKPFEVHEGYFAMDKNKHYVNPKFDDKSEGLSSDETAFDLIMKNKERLLSIDEPVRFIFSHSALREGWDNPNVFQICTLKHSNSYVSKRQEIGRGLRICVDSQGNRMDYSILNTDFHKYNTLTIIASESYESFANDLQKEVLDSISDRPRTLNVEIIQNYEFRNLNGEIIKLNNTQSMDLLFELKMKGYIDKDYNITDSFMEDVLEGTFTVPSELNSIKQDIIEFMEKVKSNASIIFVEDERKNNIKQLTPNENFYKQEFQDLWDKIKIKSFYEVNFDSEELIKKCIASINERLKINRITVKVTEAQQRDQINALNLREGNSIIREHTRIEDLKQISNTSIKYDLIGEISRSTKLKRSDVCKILIGIYPLKFEEYKFNPEDFIKQIGKLINNEKATTLINSIRYNKTDQSYDDSLFTQNIDGCVGINAFQLKKNIYDYLITDSEIEKKFAEELELGDVKYYAKLPSGKNGFKIPTPLGFYNPDWAIVFDNSDYKYIYFVAETKGTLDSLQLKGSEIMKIEYARKHFESITSKEVGFDFVNSFEDLINKIMR